MFKNQKKPSATSVKTVGNTIQVYYYPIALISKTAGFPAIEKKYFHEVTSHSKLN